jgi:hypothetical protein
MERLTRPSAGGRRVAVLLVGVLLTTAYAGSDSGPVEDAQSATHLTGIPSGARSGPARLNGTMRELL